MARTTIVEDAGVLACAAVLVALALRLLVGYAYAWAQRRQRRQARRLEEAAAAAADGDGLSEPLLPEAGRSGEQGVYVLRSPVFRWLRETFAFLLGVAYLVRACTTFYHSKDPTAGTRLVLVGCGWWLLAQVEESPGFPGPASSSSSSPVPAPQSPAWLTLTLGYVFYLALAVHPLLVNEDGPTITVALCQLCAAALAVALLALEAVVALIESRRRQQGKPSYLLFKTLRVPPTPEQTASLLSTIVFGWMDPIIGAGKRKILAPEDLYELEQEDRSAFIWARFRPHAAAMERAHRERPRPQFTGARLFRALFRTWPATFVAISLFQLVTSLCEFGIPLALRYLVNFIKNYQGEPIPPAAYAMAATLFVAPALSAIANVQQFLCARRLIFRWRAALVSLVFRQTLRIDPSVASYSSGQVVNLMSVDANACDAVRYFPFIWSIPLEVFISIGLIFWVLDSWISGLVGVVLVAFSVYITVRLSERLRTAQKQLMRRKDARLSLLGEALQGVRILKLLAWERDFLKKLDTARAAELRSLRAFILSRALVSILWVTAPILVSVLTFLLHTMVLKRELSASQGYTTLALFGILRSPLSSLSTYVNTWIKAQVSMGRLERFILDAPLLQRYEGRLLTEEDDEGVEDGSQQPQQYGAGPGEVRFRCEAGFAWGGTQSVQPPMLGGVDLHARPGELVCIYGATGAGKSSLLMALLGEMRAASSSSSMSSAPGPSVLCGGAVSYVAQRPWILHATVRENILFGQPMDPARYEAALEACALRPDLEAWDGGDLTEVGEKGVQCSGGQQQRISLCRAVYARSNVVLLDDVLSAVDAHVAKHILTQCLAGPLLRGRTVILVTHQVALTLPVADQIVVIGEGGRVELQGRPKDAGQSSPEMRAFLAQHAQGPDAVGEGGGGQEEEGAAQAGAANGAATLIRKEGEGKRVVAAEEKVEGRVKLRVYTAYIQAAGGSVLALLALATYAGAEALNFFQNKSLGAWVDQLESSGSGSVAPYLWFSAASVLVLVAQSLLTAFCSLLASRRIHHAMAHRVLRAPMAWFETTPVGRIQNRFSMDMDTIDTDLMDTTNKLVARLAAILTITSVIASAMAPLILGIVPILLASAYVGWAYQKSAQELKRLDSITRSPIYSHFAESVAGLATIRAYNREAAFVQESCRRVDASDKIYHHLWCANRWLALRLQLLGSVVTGMVGAYILATLGRIPGPTAGLVLLFCMNFADCANVLIRQQAQLEMDFNSIERNVIEYTEELEQEAPAIIPAHRPPSPAWPASGELHVQNLRLRYPSSEADVLRGLSFHIPPHTRVGVVGRTGAGKTSLVAALFRLVEPSAGSSIRVDGEDALTLGLEDLRSRLAIVPQEPVCFAGSVRSNLDPFGEYDDAALWRALEKAQLRGRVVKSLDDPVAEGGSNFSQGERALLCMSRALLRMRGVLVMDEATANVDPQTDAAIQAMVRSDLGGCTVLTVAHRLKTVAYYDLVFVMDQGQIVEQGSPLELFKTPGGVFRELALQTGEFDTLTSLAWEAARENEQRKNVSSVGADRDGGGLNKGEEVKDGNGDAVAAVRYSV